MITLFSNTSTASTLANRLSNVSAHAVLVSTCVSVLAMGSIIGLGLGGKL
jgi:hypothetical protein